MDYPGEIMKVKNKILELGLMYKEKGYNPIALLLGDVNNRSYQIGPSTTFIVTKPKKREIFAADFKDRVVGKEHIIFYGYFNTSQ